jgi:SAM-dependent methyltransferase
MLGDRPRPRPVVADQGGIAAVPERTAVTVLDATDEALRATGIGWKVASWSRAMREAFRHLPADLGGKTLAELGVGPAGLNLFLGGLRCRLLCLDRRLDFSTESRALHRRHGVACEHVLTDARRLTFPPASLDVVVMKSVLGGVHSEFGREGALACIASVRDVLKPDGVLIALEQLKGDPMTRWLRRIKYPTRRWHYFEVAEFTPGTSVSLLEGFARVETRALTVTSHSAEDWLGHRSPIVRAAVGLDRLIEPVVPPNWRHLISVVATV